MNGRPDDLSSEHLLSTDPVQDRCVTVSDGIIIGNCATGTHVLNVDVDDGPPALVVYLC